MSLKALGLAYKVGLMKPTGPLPAASLAPLMVEIIAAKEGVEALVPDWAM